MEKEIDYEVKLIMNAKECEKCKNCVTGKDEIRE